MYKIIDVQKNDMYEWAYRKHYSKCCYKANQFDKQIADRRKEWIGVKLIPVYIKDGHHYMAMITPEGRLKGFAEYLPQILEEAIKKGYIVCIK